MICSPHSHPESHLTEISQHAHQFFGFVPHASTPMSSTSVLSRKARKLPRELHPPPTQAIHISGCRIWYISCNCCCISIPIIDWKSATIEGNGCGSSCCSHDIITLITTTNPVLKSRRDSIFWVFLYHVWRRLLLPLSISIQRTFGLCRL